MKKLLFLLVVSSFQLISIMYPQSYFSLDGYENTDGETVLLFRKGIQFFNYNPVYSLNVATLEHKYLIDGHSFVDQTYGAEDSKSIDDFEFFPDGNFIVTGDWIYPDNHRYVSRNDSLDFPGLDEYNYFWVDKSALDPSKVYLLGSKVARSFDGGNTFPQDSILDIYAVSKAAFDDNTFFAFADDRLIKIDESGSRVVDTTVIRFNNNAMFLYDDDNNGIYLVTKSNGRYTLMYSPDKGDNWVHRYNSTNPLYVSPGNGDHLYLCDGPDIYLSENNGADFTHYKVLPKDIVGVYKKPASDILYAATEDKLYEITPTIIIEIGSATGINENNNLVNNFSLEQNYPNPFNPVTIITYTIPHEDIVKLSVYDMLGKVVAVLVNERHSAGVHSKEFNASDLSSGVYIYKLQAGNFSESRKMILMK